MFNSSSNAIPERSSQSKGSVFNTFPFVATDNIRGGSFSLAATNEFVIGIQVNPSNPARLPSSSSGTRKSYKIIFFNFSKI